MGFTAATLPAPPRPARCSSRTRGTASRGRSSGRSPGPFSGRRPPRRPRTTAEALGFLLPVAQQRLPTVFRLRHLRQRLVVARETHEAHVARATCASWVSRATTRRCRRCRRRKTVGSRCCATGRRKPSASAVVRGRRGGRRPEKGPGDLPLLRPRDAVPRVREEQRAGRGGAGRVAAVKPMADQAQRGAALDPRRSFIVQAPAGSGKTELLVQRFLKLLSLAQKPEEILAITFTKKAAAEMRKRVLERLSISGEVAHRLRIQTIDAFCTALTRQVPVLARFGAQPEIVEDARDLYREAASR